MMIDVRLLKQIFSLNLFFDYNSLFIHVITLSIVILFVLIMSILFEKRISPCIKYSLWLLVVAKLLLPFPAVESKVHILNFVENLSEGKNGFREVYQVSGEDESAISDSKTENNGNVNLSGGIEYQFANNRFENTSDVLLIIYISGVLVCSGIFLSGNLAFYKRLRRKGKYLKTYKNEIPVYRIEEYYGACLYGGLKPVIIVGNNKGLSIEQQHMVLTHEYVHYVHGDHIWSMIRCICVTLYWYHPLVWIAAFVSRRDGEMACDEGTLKRIGKKQRFAYGQSLLEIAARAAKMKDIISPVFFYSTTAAGGKDEMKKRIIMITRGTKTSVMALLTVVILCIGCIGCTLGEPVKAVSVEEQNSTVVSERGNESVQDMSEVEDSKIDIKQEKALKPIDSKLEVAETDVSETTQKIEFSEVKKETVSEVVLVADDEGNVEGSKFVWPTISTTISTDFGTREHPITGEKRVIDYMGIAGNEGDSVYAVADGAITEVGFDSKKGNYIVLTTEGGEVVTYGHLMGSKAPDGAEVTAGEIIGLMGKTGTATGTFLSISVSVDGEMIDPMNYFE